MFFVDAELCRVGAQVTHGGFDVVNRRWKLEHGSQLIVDGRRNIAVLSQLDRHRQIAAPVAAAESAAVDQNDARILPRRFRTHHVHRQLAMRNRSVVNGAVNHDVRRNRQIGGEAERGKYEKRNPAHIGVQSNTKRITENG